MAGRWGLAQEAALLYCQEVSFRFSALVIHSQPEVLTEIVELLSGPRLRVESAHSYVEATNKIRRGRFQVILVGHAPPELDGVQLLEASISSVPDALRILVNCESSAAERLDKRPDESPPIVRYSGRRDESSRLLALVHEGMQMLQLVKQQKDLVVKLSGDHRKLQNREKLLDVVVKERTAELEESYLKLKAANRQALFGLAEAIETKDPYTKGHCGRVAAYSMVLAEAAGYPEDGLETLEFGAFLHDIGKIGVRDAVLLKPGPLDQEEWMHMREHPLMGYEIASKIEMLKTIIPAVRNHHERWDGKGYPDKLVGEAIPIAARIVAIADAYDAMATDRPYKTGLPLEDCEKLLRKNAGKMFDSGLVDVFCQNHLGAIYDERYDDEGYEDGYENEKPESDALATGRYNDDDDSYDIDLDDLVARV